MIIKNGFIFIELMVGLLLSVVLISIISHYIIESKNVQQEAIMRIEALSIARSSLEKMIAHSGNQLSFQSSSEKFNVSSSTKKRVDTTNTNHCMHTISVVWKTNNNNRSLSLDCYIPEKEEMV